MDKRFKGLVAISDVLDDRYQKLSDKYHELELSHNRKKVALERLLKIFAHFSNSCVSVTFDMDGKAWNEMVLIVSHALFCDGRKNTCLKLKNIIKGSKKNANSSNPEK